MALLVQKLRTPATIETRVASDGGDTWKRVARTFVSIEPTFRGRIINEDQQGFSSAMFDGLARRGTKIANGDRLVTEKGSYYIEATREVDSDRSVIALDLVKKDA